MGTGSKYSLNLCQTQSSWKNNAGPTNFLTHFWFGNELFPLITLPFPPPNSTGQFSKMLEVFHDLVAKITLLNAELSMSLYCGSSQST